MQTFSVALIEILVAWRRVRHPRLADLADFLDARVAEESPRAPLPASKKRADLEAWSAREALREPLDFSVLMKAARGGQQADVIAHVEALAQWDDPRLVAGLLALLEDPPYAGVKSRAMLKAIFTALEGTRDRRVVARARELGGRYLGIVHSSTGGWIAEQLLGVAARMETLPQPALPAELQAQCEALEARLGNVVISARVAAAAQEKARRSLDYLFAAVYAAPDDDAPRLVLADALGERGDERGELIALQIARARGESTEAQKKREAELTRDSQRLAQWSQPLSNAGECTLERGFPQAVRIYSKSIKSHIELREWATVTQLHNLVSLSNKQAIELLSQPTLTRVTLPGTIKGAVLNGLAAVRSEWPWLELGVTDADELRADAFRITPALRRLSLSANGPLPRGLLQPLTKLAKLGVFGPHTTLDNDCFAAAPPLSELELKLVNPVEKRLALPATLRTLKLQLARLPPGLLTGLPALHALDLELYELAEVAGAFASLTALASLRLSCPYRVALPKGSLAGLAQLARLDLTVSMFEPAELAQLASLEEVSIMLRAEQDNWTPFLEALEATPVRRAKLHSWKDRSQFVRNARGKLVPKLS